MKMLELKQIYNCSDVMFVKEVIFDKKIDIDFINYLKKFGNLMYFSEFPKPYYQVDIAEMAILKGVEGSYSMQVVFFSEKFQKIQKFLLKLLREYRK